MSRRSPSIALASVAVVSAATWLGLRGEEPPTPRLDLIALRGDNRQVIPARVYLFKDGRPFRLSPVDALLPLRVDTFYRERLWQRGPGRPQTLEVTLDGESHFILLDGRARFDLPAGRYRVEAHHGFELAPAAREFTLDPGQELRLELALDPMAGGEPGRWISGDDHIHLVRRASDDDVFLRWIRAEDLSVANFLQLQRQVDAAAQYAFGKSGEAAMPGASIRPGHESRSEFYGHVNILGPRELIRPLSVGKVYANSPEAYPFPNVLFRRARALGATVGYAHFDGSMEHSTLPLDLAAGVIDFVEVFQFGVLKAEPWYGLLNAGFRVTGVAGSDFPANLPRVRPWPRAMPLLGPERTLVKAGAAPSGGESAYERWAEGVRKGAAVVSNGPILDLDVDGRGAGAVVDWSGKSTEVRATATAWFVRPLELLELVVNGRVVAARAGDGTSRRLELKAPIPLEASGWVAARVRGERSGDEPERLAHTNPVYVLRDRMPVHVPEARAAILGRWLKDVAYYESDALTFARPEERRELQERLGQTTRILSNPPTPWR